ncbi:amino acid permease, partial [Enterococcus faecium]
WHLGKLSLPVALMAVLWAGFAFVNIVWPRTVSDECFINWEFFVAMGAILALGIVIVKVRKVGQQPPGALDDEPRSTSEAELV